MLSALHGWTIIIRTDPAFANRAAGEEAHIVIHATLDTVTIERRGRESELLRLAGEVAREAGRLV